MKINICTRVASSMQDVQSGFQEDLFKALALPFPKLNLLRFDGSRKGDFVILELNFFLFKQIWESEIIFSEQRSDAFIFIDVGRKLPFFLKTWQHRHVIEKESDNISVICDQIQYTSHFKLLTWLLYPALYLQFLYRKPVYRRFFGKVQ